MLLSVACFANLFSDGNDAQVYELVTWAHETKQGEKTVAEYYAEYEHYGKKSTMMMIFKLIVFKIQRNITKNS